MSNPAGRLRRAAATLGRIIQPYDPAERDAARFRAHQLRAVVQVAPMSAVVNIGNAVVLWWALAHRVGEVVLSVWVLSVTAVALLGLRGWLLERGRPPRASASERAIRRTVHHGLMVGGVWAALPLATFAGSEADVRLLVGIVTTGMICAGGFALSSVPVAAFGYVLVLGGAALVSVAHWDSPVAGGLSLLLAIYCAILLYSVWAAAKTLGARLVAEARADRQNEVIALLLRDFEDHASDLLWETDAGGRLSHAAPRLAAALGVPDGALRRAPALAMLRRRLSTGDESRHHWDDLRVALDRRTAFRDQAICVAADGGSRWWSLSARPLLDDAGRLQGWRGVAADVTDRQLAHRRLRWLAHNDALTGLVNRTQFRDLLQSWLQGPQAAVLPLAVLTFDLDGFKQVNDTLGHAAGDLLLQTFGARLLSVVRRNDTVARLGGDEFAMVVRGAGSRAAIEPLIDRLMAALAQPARIFDQTVSLRASVGIAFAPVDGDDVDTLMRHADVAMYSAKHRGGHRCCYFDTSLAELARRRGVLGQDLQGAVGRGEFRLEFQPQVGTADLQVRGFEALLRWHHPVHGNVAPAEFVAIAESAGMMVEIGGWVLEEACRQARGWPADLSVSINVSATQLAAPDFLEQVDVAARGLRPDRVELEITESALLDDSDTVLQVLRALRERGHRIALDDFGTGYSALGYLRRYPFDTLKIDRSFVTDLARNNEAQVIVDTTLAMARALRMATVAEGVESPLEARMLRERGCAALQGYLMSRPLPADGVVPFLDSWPHHAIRLLEAA